MEVVSCGRRKIFGTIDDILLYRAGTLGTPCLNERDNLELGTVTVDVLNFLLQGCLQLTPANRPTAEQMVTYFGMMVKESGLRDDEDSD